MIHSSLHVLSARHARNSIVVGFGMLVAAALLGSACAPTGRATTAAPASSSPQPSSSNAGAPAPVVGGTASAAVSMTDALRFSPADVTISKGGTVTWRNSTSMVHSVTDDPSVASKPADAGLPPGAQAWDSGDINPGQSFSHTFTTPGTYRYFCKPHELAGMVGSVTVTG